MDEEEDLYACPGYPEHDYVVADEDEESGDVVLRCRRCDAEVIEIGEARG